MSTSLSPRVQAALEQISEDETLISDVTDDTAAAVMRWLREQIVAADKHDDRQFEETVTQLRNAARTAARQSNDDPATFVTIATTIAQAADARRATTTPPAPGAPAVVEQAAAVHRQTAGAAVDAVNRPEDVAVPVTPAALPARTGAAPISRGPSRRQRRRAKGKR